MILVTPTLWMRHDQAMSIDPVAAYAAVVATGALGWQVYQWRLERRGKLDERKGELDLELSTNWRAHDNKLLYANFINRNDYPVRLDMLKVGTVPTTVFMQSTGGAVYIAVTSIMPAEKSGLPTSVVPAHDSLVHRWHAVDLRALLGDAEFRPGYVVTVEARNSLGHWYSAATEIEDSRRHYPPNPVQDELASRE